MMQCTHAYSFNPKTGTIQKSEDPSPKSSRIHIKLTTSKEFPLEKVEQTIIKLGTYSALKSIINTSEDTKSNYCNHTDKCGPAFSYCTRYLTEEQIRKCNELIEEVDCDKVLKESGLEGKYSYNITPIFFPKFRGNLKLMERILNCAKEQLANAV